MTDLPFGRGGSPLQNLIKNGYNQTKISAFRVNNELDAGPIYLKKDLLLQGNARSIFNEASFIINEMIIEIIENELTPIPQNGKPTFFKRRVSKQSNIKGLNTISEVYDHIRMLDCEGYPKAFVEFENLRIEFDNAKLNKNNKITANVRIMEK